VELESNGPIYTMPSHSTLSALGLVAGVTDTRPLVETTLRGR